MKSSGRSNQVEDHCLSLDFEVGFFKPGFQRQSTLSTARKKRSSSDPTLSNVAGLFLNAVSARFRQSSHSQQAATHSVHFGQYSNFGTRLEHLAHATSVPAVASIMHCARAQGAPMPQRVKARRPCAQGAPMPQRVKARRSGARTCCDDSDDVLLQGCSTLRLAAVRQRTASASARVHVARADGLGMRKVHEAVRAGSDRAGYVRTWTASCASLWSSAASSCADGDARFPGRSSQPRAGTPHCSAAPPTVLAVLAEHR